LVLALATIVLVAYTVRQVGQSRAAAERTAHDALLERLEARGPQVVVRRSRFRVELYDDAAGDDYGGGPAGANVPMRGQRYLISDEHSLAGLRLHCSVDFTVIGVGDVPAFATGAASTERLGAGRWMDTALRDTSYSLSIDLFGDQIRETADRGEWLPEQQSPFARSVIMVTDATHAVQDRYVFEFNWWPFEREGPALLVSRVPGDEVSLPFYVPAVRSYPGADRAA
jgi:hypothetical protein